MNPKTNRFEPLTENIDEINKECKERLRKALESDYYSPLEFKVQKLLRPDGSEVPKHWSIFQINENYMINNYTFKCVYIGETSILFEPVGPMIIGEDQESR